MEILKSIDYEIRLKIKLNRAYLVKCVLHLRVWLGDWTYWFSKVHSCNRNSFVMQENKLFVWGLVPMKLAEKIKSRKLA